MNAIHTIEHHVTIRETVGYQFMESVPVEDVPAVMEFLQIVRNYKKLKRIEAKR